MPAAQSVVNLAQPRVGWSIRKACWAARAKAACGRLSNAITLLMAEEPTPREQALGLIVEWTEVLSGRPEPTTH